MYREVSQELARREILSRIESLESELAKAESDIDSLTAKNLELSQRASAAESEVKALNRSLREEKAGRSEDKAAHKDAIVALRDKLSASETNLSNVVKARDLSVKQLEREAKDAKAEAKEHRQAVKELTAENVALRKEVQDVQIAAASVERPVPEQLVIRKKGAEPVIVDVVKDPAQKIERGGLTIN
jgi:chromosome segregation ATPase